MRVKYTFLLAVGLLIMSSEVQSDQISYEVAFGTGVALSTAALVYYCVDSNQTLLYKADMHLRDLDLCLELISAMKIEGQAQELFFEKFLENKFGVSVADIKLGSSVNYHILTKYMKQMRYKLDQARDCVEFRSRFFTDMHHKLLEIQSLEFSLRAVRPEVKLFADYLLGHQILNFYKDLPILSTSDSLQEQQVMIIKWIRRGYYSNTTYPLIEGKEQMERDLKELTSLYQLYKVRYPALSQKLYACRDILEVAFDLLLESGAFQAEKDDKYKADMLAAEQARVSALREQAAALRDQAWAQQQQAWAQQQQAWKRK